MTLRRMLGCTAALSPAMKLLNMSLATETIFSSPAMPALPNIMALNCCSTWPSLSENSHPISWALGPTRSRKKASRPSLTALSSKTQAASRAPRRLMISFHTTNSASPSKPFSRLSTPDVFW